LGKGKWKMVDGRWWMDDGGWMMEDGCMEQGDFRK